MTVQNYLRKNPINLKTILSVMVIFFSFTVKAQQKTSISHIRGYIKDAKLSPIDYATVSLLNAQDSSVVTVAFADDQGLYEFKEVKPGNYFISANTMGYEENLSSLIEINDALKHEYLVADIVLKESSTSLEEVVIDVKRPLIERRPDMLVVNVENSSLAAGNNALDILERSPGISVDKDDNISLQGKQGTLILIDGKETHLSASQLANLLRSTDGNNIQSLEIITSPSAKYDAKGTAGIINIKLKKSKQSGTNGSLALSGGYGNSHKTTNSLSLNHKDGKFNVYGNYSYLNNDSDYDIGIYRLVGQGSSFTSFDQFSQLTNQRNNHSMKAGVDFQSSEKNVLSLQINMNQTKRVENNDNITNIGSYQTVLDSVLTGSTLSNNKFSNYSVALSNVYNIDTVGRKLSADLDFSQFKDSNLSDYQNYLRNPIGEDLQVPTILHSKMPSTVRIQTAKMDYTHPINADSKFEAGAKVALVKTDNDMVFEKLIDNSWENMPDRTNHFIYDERVAAAYVSYGLKIKKVGIQTGLRGEYTFSDGNSITLNKRVKRNYLDLFPNISINYSPSEQHQIGLSYSRRIDRPYYNNLNPFTYYLDDYTSVRGNPYLQPEYTQAFELNYTLLQRFNFTTGMNLTKDAIVELMEQDDVKKTTTVYRDNFASSETWFFNINAPITITKFWSSNTNISAFYLGFKSRDVNNPVNTGQFAAQLYNNNTFTILPSLKAEATLNYQSALTYSIYKIDPQWGVDVGVNKSFNNNKANIKFAVTDIFNTKKQNITTRHANLNTDVRQKHETRVFRLSLTYNFGSAKIERRDIDRSSAEKNRVAQ